MISPRKLSQLDRIRQRRQAVLYAETVAVCCPHCAECQPDPDAGSEFWTIDQLRAGMFPKTFTCVGCDAPFRLLGVPGKVQVSV